MAAVSATPVAEEEESGPFAPAFYSGLPLATTYGYGVPSTYATGYYNTYNPYSYYTPYYSSLVQTPAATTLAKRSAEPEPFFFGGLLRRAFRRRGGYR